MFTGDYGFFDYKYNIEGYTGQDFGGIGQYLYLSGALILMVVLLLSVRRIPMEKARRVTGYIGIFLTVFYLAKTAWESWFDITLSGAFNTGLLPFDTCSLIMPAAILTGFGKGRIRKMAECWITTGGILGGLSNMLFLNALKYYPFFTFGAFYSMIWHFLMVFAGVMLIASSGYLDPARVREGFLFHLAASVPVIAMDFVFGFDFMLYRSLGGVPFFEGIAGEFTKQGLMFLNPLLMLFLYFACFMLIFGISALVKNRKRIPVQHGHIQHIKPAA